MWLLIGRWQLLNEEHKAILGLFHEIGEANTVREGFCRNPNNPYIEFWLQEVPVKTPVKIVIQ